MSRGKAFRESFEDRRRQTRDGGESSDPKKEDIGTCSCKGKIILLTTYTSQYNPMAGPLIIGPGSQGQFRRVEDKECYCENCGTVYNPEIVKKRRE